MAEEPTYTKDELDITPRTSLVVVDVYRETSYVHEDDRFSDVDLREQNQKLLSWLCSADRILRQEQHRRVEAEVRLKDTARLLEAIVDAVEANPKEHQEATKVVSDARLRNNFQLIQSAGQWIWVPTVASGSPKSRTR